MKKKINITYIILLILTITVAVISSNKSLFSVILVLALLKFWMVAFQFMELKNANGFWKFLIIVFGLVIGGAVLLIT